MSARPNVQALLDRAMAMPRLLDAWEPEGTVTCGNCLYATVHGAASNPIVHCAKGHGRPVAMFALLRRKSPRSPAMASKCPDFTSMDDDA